MMNKNTLYIANPDVSYREEEDGVILFNPDTDQVLVINVTGQLIWQALVGPCSQEELVTTLLEQCENVPQDQVVEDVRDFVQALLAKGFIGTYVGDAS